MAAVTRGTKGGLTTPEPPNNARVGAGYATAAGTAPCPCHFTANGGVTPSIGTAANAAAVVDGWVLKDFEAGECVTLYADVTVSYGNGAAITPGAFYYLGTTAGGLDTATTTGGTVPIARGVPDNSLFGAKQTKLRVKASY